MTAARLLYTPPSYVLRGPIYLIFVILVAGLAYSVWAKKDVLVIAPMVLEKSAFTIEAVGGGMVSNIAARENSPVASGDTLLVVQEQIRVSSTPEQEALEKQRFDLRRERDKLEDEYKHKLSQLELDLADVSKGGATAQQALTGRVRQIQEQLTTAERARDRQAERLELARTQFARKKTLFDQHDITVVEFERVQEAVHEAEKGLDDAKARIEEVRISAQTARDELSKVSSLNSRQKLEDERAQLQERRDRDLKRIDEQIASIEAKLKQGENLVGFIKYKDNLAEYKADFDGLLTKILVKPGQIVAPGTPLVILIKHTAVLEGHAFVDNKDIGHLKRGQAAKIKYFAYPYQEYGIATGLISDIATTPSGLPGKESKYVVTIVLRDETISKHKGRSRQLEIGLEGVAEVKTGDKRFIEILFAPISKFLTPEEEPI